MKTNADKIRVPREEKRLNVSEGHSNAKMDRKQDIDRTEFQLDEPYLDRRRVTEEPATHEQLPSSPDEDGGGADVTPIGSVQFDDDEGLAEGGEFPFDEPFDSTGEQWVKLIYHPNGPGSRQVSARFAAVNGDDVHIPSGVKLCIRQRYIPVLGAGELGGDKATFLGFGGKVRDGSPEVDSQEFFVIGGRLTQVDALALGRGHRFKP